MRNLAPRASTTGHMFAFTPKPYRLDTQIRAEGEDKLKGPRRRIELTSPRWPER